MCEGHAGPIDAFISHVFPFATYAAYAEMALFRRGFGTMKRFNYLLYLFVEDLTYATITKRYHNFVDGVFWRDDYSSQVCYIYSECDILFDVPF